MFGEVDMHGVDREERHHVMVEGNHSLKSWSDGEWVLEVLMELVDRDDSYNDQNVECCKGEDIEGIDEDMGMHQNLVEDMHQNLVEDTHQNWVEDMHQNWEGGMVDLKVVEHEEGTHNQCYMGMNVKNCYNCPLAYTTRLHFSYSLVYTNIQTDQT